MALTASIPVKEARGNYRVYPVAANKVIYAGSAVALDAAGNAVEPTAGGGTAVGVAAKLVDNTGGAAGDKSVEIHFGCFGFKNAAGADAITQAAVGKNAYFVDGGTVAVGDGGGSRSTAGRISFIENGLIYVNVGFGFWVS